MYTVIGLGNVGKKYESTRHNAGFMALDAYANKHDLNFNERTLFHCFIAIAPQLILAKPTTFMNESGQAAKMLLKQYEGDLVVVYDDIDIPISEIKVSFAKNAGGHNGVQSIIDHLGTKDFFRIRVGVRPVHEELQKNILPPHGFENFLLSNFAPQETELREQGIAKAVAVLESLSTKSFEEIMNMYN